MELKDLDKIHKAEQLMNGIRDNLIMLENSSVKEIPPAVCVVLETALEKAITLLNDTAAVIEEELD